MKHIIFGLLLSFSLLSCEECIECNPRTDAPRVRLAFYADRTLKETQAVIDSVSVLLEESRALLDTTLTDSQDSLLAVIAMLSEDSIAHSLELADFRSGALYLDTVMAVDGIVQPVYTDTLLSRFLHVPLNMKEERSVFSFRYLLNRDTLALLYEQELVQDIDGVQLLAEGIAVDERYTSFDSVRLVCSRGICNHRNTTVEIFY